MNRLDLLTLKMAEEALTADEARELEVLLQDPVSRRSHVALLELIASLAGRRPDGGLREAVMNRIQEEISGGIRKNVLEQIRRLPRTARRARERRRPAWLLWSLGGLAAAGLIVFVLRPDSAPRPSLPKEPPTVARPPAPRPPPEPEQVVRPEPAPRPAPPRPPGHPATPVTPAPAPEVPQPGPPPTAAPEAPTPSAPVPTPPPPPAPPPPPTVVEPAVVARLDAIEGEVHLAGDGRRVPARAELPLRAGQSLVTGRGSGAVLLLPDGTRVQLGALSELGAVADGLLLLETGRLEARVAKRPDDAPLVFRTPVADARVLGTVLGLSAEEGTTTLDVVEGRVRLTRRSDQRSVDVAAGQTAVTSAALAPARGPSPGLLGHWRLDEAEGATALDGSGRQNHARIVGEARREAGRHQGALRLGPGGQLFIPDLQVPERFTAAFWIYHPVLTKDQDGYVGFGKNGFSMIREGNMQPRQIRMGFSAAPQEFHYAAAAIPPKEWTHVAAACDGQDLRLYVNGSPQGARKLAAPRKGEPGVSFGRIGPGGEGWFDDIRIYDRVLTPAEIRLVMAGGLALPTGKR